MIDKCSIEGCEEDMKAKGLCSMHHQRWYRTGETGSPFTMKKQPNGSTTKTPFKVKECNAAGCTENGKRLGFCEFHLSKWNL